MEGKRQLRCNVLRTVGLLLTALAYVLSSCTDEGITVPESGYTTIIICPDADNYKVRFIIYYESKNITAPAIDYSSDF